MKAENINKWIFEIPLSDVQTTDEDITIKKVCACCGKPIKEEKYFVHLLTNGKLISSDQHFDNSQGFFPIGNECKNRLPNNFYFKA